MIEGHLKKFDINIIHCAKSDISNTMNFGSVKASAALTAIKNDFCTRRDVCERQTFVDIGESKIGKTLQTSYGWPLNMRCSLNLSNCPKRG